jgi:hypothetical protein
LSENWPAILIIVFNQDNYHRRYGVRDGMVYQRGAERVAEKVVEMVHQRGVGMGSGMVHQRGAERVVEMVHQSVVGMGSG